MHTITLTSFVISHALAASGAGDDSGAMKPKYCHTELPQIASGRRSADADYALAMHNWPGGANAAASAISKPADNSANATSLIECLHNAARSRWNSTSYVIQVSATVRRPDQKTAIARAGGHYRRSGTRRLSPALANLCRRSTVRRCAVNVVEAVSYRADLIAVCSMKWATGRAVQVAGLL